MGGYLLYLRKNGSLELAGLPVNLLEEKKYSELKNDEEHVLQFEIDGDNLVAHVDNNLKKCLKIRGLDDQSPGDESLSCHGSDSAIVFREVETVVRNTMNFDLPKRKAKI